MSITPLFIVWEGWIWRGKIQMLSVWIWRLFLVTREVWLAFFLWYLLNLHLHLLFMSHRRCALSLYIGTPYIYIYTFLLCFTKNYSKEITKRDIHWCSSSKSLALLLVILWGMKDVELMGWVWATWAWALGTSSTWSSSLSQRRTLSPILLEDRSNSYPKRLCSS